MKIINKVDIPQGFYNLEHTLHLDTERMRRFKTYIDTFGCGIVVDAFEVDKGHPNGNEIHVLCNNRLVYIFNKRTERFITILYARPRQLKRYYKHDMIQRDKFDKYVEGYNEI